MCAGSMALHPYHRVSATIGGVDSYSTYTGRNLETACELFTAVLYPGSSSGCEASLDCVHVFCYLCEHCDNLLVTLICSCRPHQLLTCTPVCSEAPSGGARHWSTVTLPWLHQRLPEKKGQYSTTKSSCPSFVPRPLPCLYCKQQRPRRRLIMAHSVNEAWSSLGMKLGVVWE